ncbi:MAG: hypothetical protein JWO42_4015 [Chloroflexi bacterium]|nr:hypothetical protein [Chloroflexota bacterium]
MIWGQDLPHRLFPAFPYDPTYSIPRRRPLRISQHFGDSSYSKEARASSPAAQGSVIVGLGSSFATRMLSKCLRLMALKDIVADRETSVLAIFGRHVDGTNAAPANGVLDRAIGLGVVAGLRSATAPAALSLAHSRGDVPLKAGGLLNNKWLGRAMPVGAVGEYIADKLPSTPSRLSPAGLAGRLASGAGVGSALYRGAGRPRWQGAALGAVGAFFGSVAGNRYRTYATKATGLPDLPFALAEDAVAIASAYTLFRRPRYGLLLAIVAMLLSYRLRKAPTETAAK